MINKPELFLPQLTSEWKIISQL